LGFGLVTAGMAILSAPAALIVAGCLLLAWAGWRIARKRGQG
jgi:threonine/homoserine/homoserine lactone efflux protein